MGTSSVKRNINTFNNIYSYYLSTASENDLNAVVASQIIRVVYNFEIIFARVGFQTNNLLERTHACFALKIRFSAVF